MSDETTKENELKYHERLNISVLSISRIKDLLKNDIMDTIAAWTKGKLVDKQCYHIIGPAGVGKTQICYQIAEELTKEIFGAHNKKNPDNQKEFGCIMVKSPVLSRDDFIIPFPVKKDGEEDYSFKMLYSDFVPKTEDTYGLFVIDEFSRGDHQLQQLLWQIQNEYSVHCHEFPKGWFVVSIDNPDDSEYSMDNLEDAAGLRRQLHVYTEVSAVDFLNYAIENDFHPYVIEFIQTHPERLYDFQAQKIGSVYANPASYEKLSDHLWKMETRRNNIDFAEIEVKASGLLNTNMTRLFIEFARDKKDINPKDVFRDFRKVKPEIQKLIKESNNSKLSELMVGFCTYMTTTMPEYDDAKLKNVLDFLLIMPIDTAALFISQIDSFDRSSEAFRYMTKVHLALLKSSKAYKKNFYKPIVAAGEGTL
jgi:DNA polymerase III delta prime subunit